MGGAQVEDRLHGKVFPFAQWLALSDHDQVAHTTRRLRVVTEVLLAPLDVLGTQQGNDLSDIKEYRLMLEFLHLQYVWM